MNGDSSRGIIRPFRRDGKSDFMADGGEAAIRSSVGQILGTMAGGEEGGGELFWRPEFGSRLHLLRHKRNDAVLQELARVYAVDALKKWEPRVQVKSVEVTRETQEGENILAVRLRYDVVDLGGGSSALTDVQQTVTLPTPGT